VKVVTNKEKIWELNKQVASEQSTLEEVALKQAALENMGAIATATKKDREGGDREDSEGADKQENLKLRAAASASEALEQSTLEEEASEQEAS
jgi:hypothetical protein